MNKYLFAFVAETLREYPFYDDMIANIESEIRNPIKPTDENVGGGRSNFPHTDEPIINVMSRIDANKSINNIKHNQLVINKALYAADNDTQAIINRLYCDEHANDTLQKVALELDISRKTVTRKRTAFFEAIVESLRPINRF